MQEGTPTSFALYDLAYIAQTRLLKIIDVGHT